MRRFLFSLGLMVLMRLTAGAVEPVVVKDIFYAGTDDRLRALDVYSPTEGERCPVVLWICLLYTSTLPTKA